MEDHSQAISFANSYFSLVDGLAPGLEYHLAENVVLDWFGKTIRGRKNVMEFMKFHKVSSRHLFNSISPANDINYGKSQTNSRKFQDPGTDSHDYSRLNKELNFEKLSIHDSENNNVSNTPDCHSLQSTEIFDNEGNEMNELHTTYELCENDLTNLFTLEITSTRKEDMEESISKMKSEEKSIKNKLLTSDIIQGDNDLAESSCTIKYVEANGQIEFSKKSNKRGANLQTWRRQSQLQIAYSFMPSGVDDQFDQEMKADDISLDPPAMTNCKIPCLLPSLGEIPEISNKLVPNINNYGGYFSTLDFTAERDHFLENFNAELTQNNSTASLKTPRYIDNRLVFTDTHNTPFNSLVRDDTNRYKENGFVFNYLIHIIIYQSNSKCRRSLTKEFQVPNTKHTNFSSNILE